MFGQYKKQLQSLYKQPQNVHTYNHIVTLKNYSKVESKKKNLVSAPQTKQIIEADQALLSIEKEPYLLYEGIIFSINTNRPSIFIYTMFILHQELWESRIQNIINAMSIV